MDRQEAVEPYRALLRKRMANFEKIRNLINLSIDHHIVHYNFEHDPSLCQMNVGPTSDTCCDFENEFSSMVLLITSCLKDLKNLLKQSENVDADTSLTEEQTKLVERFKLMPDLFEKVETYIKSVGEHLVQKPLISWTLKTQFEQYLKESNLAAAKRDKRKASPLKVTFKEDNEACTIKSQVIDQTYAMQSALCLLSIHANRSSNKENEEDKPDWAKRLYALPHVGYESPAFSTSTQFVETSKTDEWRIIRFYFPTESAPANGEYFPIKTLHPAVQLPYQDIKIQPTASIADALDFFKHFLKDWENGCIYLRTHPLGSGLLMDEKSLFYDELNEWKNVADINWPRFYCSSL
eukprot:Platyproteum_vivax@DN4370_c0_g1_i1.p1